MAAERILRADDEEEVWVVTAFRRFYSEVLRLRDEARSGLDADDDGPDAGDTARYAAAARRARDTLQALLERQALEAGRRGGDFGAAFYRQAQYVMATLADEVFLNLDWAGRPAWAGNLLETRLFGSHFGGERFFADLDALLHERDAVKRPLGAVYLLALSLGFQGRWRGVPGAQPRLAKYRRDLLQFAYPRHGSVARGDRRLFEEAYERTLKRAGGLGVPGARAWTAALVVAALFYLLVSHGLWRDATRALAETTQELQAAAGGVR